MQYQTIVLGILQDRPSLQDKLIASNSLSSTMEQLANQLRDNHMLLLEQLQRAEPNQSLILLKSEAMEIAVSQLLESMQVHPQTETDEVFSLDGAMAYLKRNTPRE